MLNFLNFYWNSFSNEMSIRLLLLKTSIDSMTMRNTEKGRIIYKEFISIKNNWDPNIDSWETPGLIPFQEDFWEFNRNLCFLCLERSLKKISGYAITA